VTSLRLALAAAVALLAGCTSPQGEALALFNVTVAPEVPPVSVLRFQVDARQVPVREVPGDPRPAMLSFGYYLPGVTGTIRVIGQALDGARCVVGQGSVDVTVKAGQASAVVPLPIERITDGVCLPADGDAGAGADLASDGPAEASDGGIDAFVPTSVDIDGGGADVPVQTDGPASSDAQELPDRCISCDRPVGGSDTCNGTTCVPACSPGQKLCAGACIDESISCNGTCPGAKRACPDNLCRVNDEKACGASCAPCVAPAHGVPTCNGTTCDFMCPAPYQRCDGACIPAGSCCKPTDCRAPSNASPTCLSNVCGFSCDTGYRPCGQGCLANNLCCTVSDCPMPLHGVPACSPGGMCSFTCTAPYQICGSACIAAGLCCTPNDCTAPPNATPTCNSGVCSFTCPGSQRMCPASCVSAGGCCSATECPAGPAGSTRTCTGGVCGVMCSNGAVPCEGACLPPVDVDSNGTEDCSENVLPNGRFNSNVSNWIGNITWSGLDADSSSSSGSAQIKNDIANDPNPSTVLANTCLQVLPGMKYAMAGRFTAPPPAAGGQAEVSVTPFKDDHCGASAGPAKLQGWPTLPGGWISLSFTFDVPPDGKSVAIELRATKPANSGILYVIWDDLVVHR
jgi:hypothetical protein